MSRNFFVGIYLYPWYNEIRWHSHKKKYTPKIGTYSSIDSNLIDWQTDLIAEAGIDYVIIETVLDEDWCYSFMMDATEQLLKFLRRKNLRWSFLIDTQVAPDRNNIVEKINQLFFEKLQPLLKAGKEEGIFAFDDEQATLSSLVLMTDFLNLDWIHRTPRKKANQVVENMITILLNGLRRSK